MPGIVLFCNVPYLKVVYHTATYCNVLLFTALYWYCNILKCTVCSVTFTFIFITKYILSIYYFIILICCATILYWFSALAIFTDPV